MRLFKAKEGGSQNEVKAGVVKIYLSEEIEEGP
jgi:hypothetical protein